VRGFIF